MTIKHKTIEAYTPHGLDDAVNEFLEQEVAKLLDIKYEYYHGANIFFAFITYERYVSITEYPE